MASKAAEGQLIALEGTQGPELEESAQRLLRGLAPARRAGGVSRWDASNAFYELRLGKAKALHPTPRSLLLLYAYDLMFRLRWEIRPSLEQGLHVVAAPYLQTAIAFGRALGLPRRWLAELFSFAPKPSACYRLKERKKTLKRKPKAYEGYIGLCCSMLRAAFPDLDPTAVRKKCARYLAGLERCERLPKRFRA